MAELAAQLIEESDAIKALEQDAPADPHDAFMAALMNFRAALETYNAAKTDGNLATLCSAGVGLEAAYQRLKKNPDPNSLA